MNARKVVKAAVILQLFSSIAIAVDSPTKIQSKPPAPVSPTPIVEKSNVVEQKTTTPSADDVIVVKVIKSRGGRALISYSDKLKLENKRYNLMAYNPADVEPDRPTRRWFFGAALDMGLFTQTTTVNSTDAKSEYKSFVFNTSIGRNYGTLEVGPFLEYSFQTVGTSDSRTFLGGLLVDINLKSNNSEADGILGIRLSGGYGQEETTSVTEPSKVTRIQPSIFYKWFGLTDSSAVVFEVGYRIQGVDRGATKLNSTGTVGKLGVIGYY